MSANPLGFAAMLISVHITDPDQRDACLEILVDNEQRFLAARGSSHNHQAWTGGYLDHVNETMRAAVAMYMGLSRVRALPFSLSEAIAVLFLHDLEKPWKEDAGLADKASRRAFRDEKIKQYGLKLTSAQKNALRYVEGENEDYTPDRRVMGPLAAFCHICDVTSARIWPDEPREP